MKSIGHMDDFDVKFKKNKNIKSHFTCRLFSREMIHRVR